MTAGAPVGGAGNGAAIEALVTAELNALAADAQALQQKVSVGDIVTATVLPSNGLSDLISILGSRVAASLPPTLVPGDTITANVTGFNGTQILLQILSTTDPVSAPAPAPSTAPTPSSLSTAPAGSTLVDTAVAPPASSPAPVPGSVPAPGIAPPVSTFVAASVRPNAPVPPPIPPGAGPVETVTVDGPPGTIPGAPGTTLVTAAFGGIEARLAATRAASVTVAAPAAPGPPAPASLSANNVGSAALRASLPSTAPPPPPPPPAAAAAPAASPPSAPPPPVAAARAAVPPPPAPPPARAFAPPPPIIATRPADVAPAPAASGAAPESGGAVASAPLPPAAPALARTIASFQDPVALVRALRLPVSPSNIAAAKLALDAPQRLPTALATLESALPQGDDPRVATLRTILAFVGKIEPASPQLATQVAAYVEHVVSGSEPTLAQLLGAQRDAATPVQPAAAAEAEGATSAAPAPTAPAATATAEPAAPAAPAPASAAAEAPMPAVALAQIAERAANLASSLKEQLFSLVTGAAPTGREAEALVPSATSALAAVTSSQLVTAQSLAASPQTMSFSLPMWLGSGYAQAQIAVDRDAPDLPSVPLDGDNFHIAFILDTKNLGTVAVDLRTVGRAFSLSVKTENLRTAQRFGDELSRLTDRLTSLRYQAASVEAVVAAPEGAFESNRLGPAVSTDAASRPTDDDGTFNESA